MLQAEHIVMKLMFVMALTPSQQVIGGAAFLLMMIRPFLRHISKESRRCAELLVQLPPDFDVEGMVAATWSVVKKVGEAECWHSKPCHACQHGYAACTPFCEGSSHLHGMSWMNVDTAAG
jgi:hypothetical protein